MRFAIIAIPLWQQARRRYSPNCQSPLPRVLHGDAVKFGTLDLSREPGLWRARASPPLAVRRVPAVGKNLQIWAFSASSEVVTRCTALHGIVQLGVTDRHALLAQPVRIL